MAIKLTPRSICGKLNKTVGTMVQTMDQFVKNPGRDFTRNRMCSFAKVIIILMTMESHSLRKEIKNLFPDKKVIKWKDLITTSAFVQARGKLNEKALPALFHQFNKKTPYSKTLNGLHPIAIDGSDANVPADIKDCNTFIPYNSNNGGYHQMHINVAFSLLDQRYSDVVIQPRAQLNEVSAACTMVDQKRVKGKCLYICDRGYVSFNLMAHIVEKGDFFLIRVKELNSINSPYKFIDIPENEEFDIPVRFLLTRKRSLVLKDPKMYKAIMKQSVFDFLPEDDKTSVYELSYRLIGIRLDNGSFEYLITNLPAKKHPISVMKQYYHLRWKIETSFLFLKYGVALNYFHSIKRESLIQEIYAKLTLFNFISLLVSCVEIDSGNTKYIYKPSFSNAIDVGRRLLMKRIAYDDVILMLQYDKTPVRPDRQFKRKMNSQRLKPLQHRS